MSAPLPLELDEIERETVDVVLDHEPGAPGPRPKRQFAGRRPQRDRTGEVLGAWTIVAFVGWKSSQTSPGQRKRQWRRFHVRHECGAERVVQENCLPALGRYCRDCRPRRADGQTRDKVRSRRKRDVRAKTESIRRLTKFELRLGQLTYPEPKQPLPATRGDCQGGYRPCPLVSCKFHLFLDVNSRTGAIKRNFPDLEPEALAVSCALDVADEGGRTLEDVGALLNVTRERVRQLETKALARFLAAGGDLREYHGEPGERFRRRLPLLEPDEELDFEEATG